MERNTINFGLIYARSNFGDSPINIQNNFGIAYRGAAIANKFRERVLQDSGTFEGDVNLINELQNLVFPRRILI
jgi:hypothetical protein